MEGVSDRELTTIAIGDGVSEVNGAVEVSCWCECPAGGGITCDDTLAGIAQLKLIGSDGQGVAIGIAVASEELIRGDGDGGIFLDRGDGGSC